MEWAVPSIGRVFGLKRPAFQTNLIPQSDSQFPQIADPTNQRVRKVSNGVITTIAGNGTEGFAS